MSDSPEAHTPRPAVRTTFNNKALAAELEELLSVVEPASVANVIIQRAFDHGATDIHLDPTTLGTRIRFRIDGELHDVLPIPADKAVTLISRIRVMAGMDVGDRRLPADGSIPATRFPGMTRDVRVGSSYTINGERLVLRLMPDPQQLSSLESLGLLPTQLNQVRQLTQAPYGLLLVVGPVGSGKTTTVYSLLNQLNQTEKSIVTIEDPVERRIPGTNQIQVQNRIGLNFVAALRGTLRQDPDIICVGEIRDPETAQIAARAANSGVLVLSTLHANNTAGAVDVLRGFGIPSMAIADCLRGVISQRLVRKVDPDSFEEVEPDEEARRLLHLADDDHETRIVRGIPTDANFQTGYSGRTAVFEVLSVTGPIRRAINDGQSVFDIQQLAVEGGMETLEESTRRKVLDKITTVDELHRIISDTEFTAPA